MEMTSPVPDKLARIMIQPSCSRRLLRPSETRVSTWPTDNTVLQTSVRSRRRMRWGRRALCANEQQYGVSIERCAGDTLGSTLGIREARQRRNPAAGDLGQVLFGKLPQRFLAQLELLSRLLFHLAPPSIQRCQRSGGREALAAPSRPQQSCRIPK